MESYRGRSFLTDFFHLAEGSQGPSMLEHVSALHPFSTIDNNIPLYRGATFYLPIHQLTDLPTITKSAAMNIPASFPEYKLLYRQMLPLLLGMYLEAEGLGHGLPLCLTIWKTARQFFPKWLPHFTFPPATYGSPNLSNKTRIPVLSCCSYPVLPTIVIPVSYPFSW